MRLLGFRCQGCNEEFTITLSAYKNSYSSTHREQMRKSEGRRMLADLMNTAKGSLRVWTKDKMEDYDWRKESRI